MKNILITGVSTGIGYDAMRHLIGQGHTVYGSVRKQEDADRLLDAFPERYFPLIFDVCSESQILDAKNQVASVLNDTGLDVLINNAGIAVPGPLSEMPLEKLRNQIDINVLGVMRVTNAFLPYLGTNSKFAGLNKKIINISSISGLFNTPFNGAYCISKHALESMGDIYRRELLKYNIDLISIEPGPIKTPIWDKALAINWSEDFKDSDYKEVLHKAESMIGQSKKDALPVEQVSRLIGKIIDKKRPKTRYIIHKNKWMFNMVAKYVPDRFVDRMINKNLFKGKKIRPI